MLQGIEEQYREEQGEETELSILKLPDASTVFHHEHTVDPTKDIVVAALAFGPRAVLRIANHLDLPIPEVEITLKSDEFADLYTEALNDASKVAPKLSQLTAILMTMATARDAKPKEIIGAIDRLLEIQDRFHKEDGSAEKTINKYTQGDSGAGKSGAGKPNASSSSQNAHVQGRGWRRQA